jgi:hypothetical protein
MEEAWPFSEPINEQNAYIIIPVLSCSISLSSGSTVTRVRRIVCVRWIRLKRKVLNPAMSIYKQTFSYVSQCLYIGFGVNNSP